MEAAIVFKNSSQNQAPSMEDPSQLFANKSEASRQRSAVPFDVSLLQQQSGK